VAKEKDDCEKTKSSRTHVGDRLSIRAHRGQTVQGGKEQQGRAFKERRQFLGERKKFPRKKESSYETADNEEPLPKEKSGKLIVECKESEEI